MFSALYFEFLSEDGETINAEDTAYLNINRAPRGADEARAAHQRREAPRATLFALQQGVWLPAVRA